MKTTLKLSLYCLLIALTGYGSVMAQATESETKQKKDCVIVAAEAYKRLQAQGIWAEVVAFAWNSPDGRKSGHAVCIFQLSKNSNILAYDGQSGTFDLKIKSADLRVIEEAYNQLIARSGYTVSEFEVLAQEPAKARTAKSLPQTQPLSQPQPSKPAARTTPRSRAPSEPTPTLQQMPQNEFLLSQSGFKAIKVTTAKQQQEVNELAQGRVSAVKYNGKLYYVYPTAQKDRIYVGRRTQFDTFRSYLKVGHPPLDWGGQDNP